MLNGVFDVQATKRREIWVDGKLAASVSERKCGLSSPEISVGYQFGHYPDKPVGRRIVCGAYCATTTDTMALVTRVRDISEAARLVFGFADNSTPPQFLTPTEALPIAIAAGQILPERPLVEGQTELKTENLY